MTADWYNGWEIHYERDREIWTGEGFVAYKGGCDIDAPYVTGATHSECIDAIDEEESP